MFTGTQKRVSFVLILICWILTACTAGAQAGSKTNPAAPSQAKPTPAALGNSVLMYEWRSGTGNPSLLRRIDPNTGQDVRGYAPIPLGGSYAYAVSPDRSTLAVVVYPSNQAPIGGRLDLIDLQTWHAMTTTVEIDRWNTQMAISPDGQKLAITTSESSSDYSHGRLVLVDLAQRSAIGQAKFDFLPTHIRFTAGSEALMVYGSAGGETSSNPSSSAQVELLGLPNLEVAWSSALPDILDGFLPIMGTPGASASDVPGPGDGQWMQPAVVFAPDKDALYIVHADKDRLTTVDFTLHKVRTAEIHPPVSLLDRLMALTAGVAYAKTPDGNFKSAAISPDGQRLYILADNIKSTQNTKSGMWETVQTPLGLKVVQPSDGLEIGHIGTQATDITLSADGNTLFLGSWGGYDHPSAPFTEVWDVYHQQLIKRLDGQHLVYSLQFNGEAILLSNGMDNGITIQSTIEAKGYTVMHEWNEQLYGDWLILP